MSLGRGGRTGGPPGGWIGPMRTVGGLPRTWGLQHHFTKENIEDDRPPSRLTRRDMGRIAGYFRRYRREWIVVLVCIILGAGLGVLPPLCVALIVDDAIPHGETGLLALLGGAMIGLAVITGLLGVLQHTLTARAGQSIMFDLRTELFRHLQRMSLHFYTTNRSGEIVSRINNDVNAVQTVATQTLVAIASNTMTLVATSITLLMMNWKLAIVAVLVVPAFYFPSLVVGRIRRRLAGRTQERQATMLGFLNERLQVGGSTLMRVFGQADRDAERFAAVAGDVRELEVRQAIVGRWLFMVLSVFSAVGPALIFWYGGLQVIEKQLTLGLLVAFSALLTLLYRPLMQLATVYVDVQASVAVFQRIFEYLDLVPDVTDRPDAVAIDSTRGHVTFEGVGYAYPVPPARVRKEKAANGNGNGNGSESGTGSASESGEPKQPFALHDIRFEIAPGERVALVGPSGAGKTTITGLVPRFFDPQAGRVCLDGRDLRDIEQASLRRQIGIVTQDTFLFHTTIRENLLYARPDATDAELAAACTAAHIHEFIAGLPDGYDTIVGERGYRLSGGEKQRVSIARALLKDPAILILDEATSSLDATSEHMIQQALETLLQNRTSLIIAHRLSTILNSDRIIVMQAGRIVESGRHDELRQRNGLYARLFEQQFAKVLATS